MHDKAPLVKHPYPHPCVECGKIAVEPAEITYDARVKYEGKPHVFHIPDLKIDQCSACHELYFTARTDDQISAGLRDHIGLLHPEEIKRKLIELGTTQRQFSSLLLDCETRCFNH
jgi:hypothetical protein